MVEGSSKTVKLGTPQYFHSGVRMLLHARAPDALNPDLDVPDLAEDFPHFRSWLGNHLLNVGLRSGIDPELRAIFLSVIRRASQALSHYLTARDRTIRYANWDCSGSIPASDYFGAIGEWESCLLQYQILIDVLNKASRGKGDWRAYTRGDGTPAERMCEMANRVKHSPRDQVRIEELTPLWLEKEGLGALDGYEVTYAELAEELRGPCKLAEDMVDPAALFRRLEEEREATSEEQEETGTEAG